MAHNTRINIAPSSDNTYELRYYIIGGAVVGSVILITTLVVIFVVLSSNDKPGTDPNRVTDCTEYEVAQNVVNRCSFSFVNKSISLIKDIGVSWAGYMKAVNALQWVSAVYQKLLDCHAR